jgi:hypothetical protein
LLENSRTQTLEKFSREKFWERILESFCTADNVLALDPYLLKDLSDRNGDGLKWLLQRCCQLREQTGKPHLLRLVAGRGTREQSEVDTLLKMFKGIVHDVKPALDVELAAVDDGCIHGRFFLAIQKSRTVRALVVDASVLAEFGRRSKYNDYPITVTLINYSKKEQLNILVNHWNHATTNRTSVLVRAGD